MITLYGMGSPNVVKVRILLHELDLDYEFVRIDVINGEQFTESFGALNPNLKVPVLVDARVAGAPIAVFESGAILMYLAERAGLFWPADLAERYRIIQWLMLQMASLGPTAGQAIHFTRAVQEPSYARTRFLIELDRLMQLIGGQLAQHSYIAGAGYSLADIAIYPWLVTLKRFFPERIANPRIEEWMERIAARPAVHDAQAASAELTREDMASLRGADAATLDRYFGRTVAG